MPAKLTLRKGDGKKFTVTHKTAHEFARELLKLPDLSIYHFDPSRAGMDDVLDTSVAAPIAQVCEEPECGNKRRKVRFITIVGEGVGIGDDEPGAFAEQVLDVLSKSSRTSERMIERAKNILREMPRDWYLVPVGGVFEKGDREWRWMGARFMPVRRKFYEQKLIVPEGLVVIRSAKRTRRLGGVH